MRSIFYSNINLYRLFVRLIYLQGYNRRYERIAELIPPGARVLEICCGDCYLYEKYLKKKNIKYIGFDINETFIKHAKKRSIDVKFLDIRKVNSFPMTEFILIHASLYQFIPDEREIIEKMLNSATDKVIIAEPVKNWASTGNFLIKKFVHIFSKQKVKTSNRRFNERTFNKLCENFKEYLKNIYKFNNSREIIATFKGRGLHFCIYDDINNADYEKS